MHHQDVSPIDFKDCREFSVWNYSTILSRYFVQSAPNWKENRRVIRAFFVSIGGSDADGSSNSVGGRQCAEKVHAWRYRSFWATSVIRAVGFEVTMLIEQVSGKQSIIHNCRT